MGQHFLTFKQLQDEAQHAISGAPDSRTPTARIVNGAIEAFCVAHDWSWRQNLTTLATVSGNGQIVLPDDFGELVDLQGFQLRTTGLRKAHPRFVIAARVNNGITPASTFSFLYFIGQKSQATSSTVPPRTLELGPVPATSTADAFYIHYRKLIPTCSADGDVPAIPYGMFELLRLWVRGWAYLQTVGTPNADWAMAQEMLSTYVSADGMADGPNAGVMLSQVEDASWHMQSEQTLGPGTSILMAGD